MLNFNTLKLLLFHFYSQNVVCAMELQLCSHLIMSLSLSFSLYCSFPRPIPPLTLFLVRSLPPSFHLLFHKSVFQRIVRPHWIAPPLSLSYDHHHLHSISFSTRVYSRAWSPIEKRRPCVEKRSSAIYAEKVFSCWFRPHITDNIILCSCVQTKVNNSLK